MTVYRASDTLEWTRKCRTRNVAVSSRCVVAHTLRGGNPCVAVALGSDEVAKTTMFEQQITASTAAVHREDHIYTNRERLMLWGLADKRYYCASERTRTEVLSRSLRAAFNASLTYLFFETAASEVVLRS